VTKSAARPAQPAAATANAVTAGGTASASGNHEAGAARVEPALKPKTPPAASAPAPRPAAASVASAGSDADWETF